jgi:hypothetical protein
MPCNALGSGVTPHVTTSVENYSVWRAQTLAQILALNEACK